MRSLFSFSSRYLDKSAALESVAVLLMVVVAAAIYDQPYFIWSVPPVWLALIAITVFLVRLRALPVLASLFFLVGAATLAWSLTPANTLLNTLWETIYLAALTVGGSIGGFVLLNSWLVVMGLERTLLLDLFNLTHYFSGSAHHLAGAQALLFMPFCFEAAVRNEKWTPRLAATLAAAACLLLILNSGARAVYLPAIPVLAVTLFRILSRPQNRVLALAITLSALVLPFTVSAVLPGPTLWTPLGMEAAAVGDRARPAAPTAESTTGPVSVSEEGGIASRLKMWDQAVGIGLEHPFGTGTGSFRNTIHAFQEYPLIGFSSAHNVFIEVFSTGGWLRLAVLIALLGASLWNGWNSARWPLALGAAGLWATMLFDITGQMPGIMVLAFWAIGSSSPPRPVDAPLSPFRPKLTLAGISLLVAIASAAWWYPPCDGVECATGRHLGYRMEVARLAAESSPDERLRLAEIAVELNPESLWAWRLRSEQAVGTEAELEATRALAEKFPLASPELYLRWASAALRADRPDEARRAIREGLAHFPEDLNPAGVPFGGRTTQYGAWLTSAQKILELTDEGQ